MNNPMDVQASASEPADEIELRELVDVLRAGSGLLAIVVATTLLGAIFYLWVTPSVYRTDAVVQVELDNKGTNAALVDVAELLGGQAPVTAELEILKSRMVLGRVVDRLNLDVVAEPRYFPIIGRALASRHATPGDVPVWGIGSYAWNGERVTVGTLALPTELLGSELRLVAGSDGGYALFGPEDELLLEGRVGVLAVGETGVSLFVQELFARPGTEFTLMRKVRSVAIANLAKNLVVAERGKQSGILSVTYEDTNRRRATEVVQGIASAYLQQNVERRSAEAEKTLEFLNEQLPILKTQLETAEAALNRYRLQQGSADLTKETELILTQSVAMESQRVQLTQKREELLQRFTESHPVIEAVDAQMRQVEREQSTIAERVKGLPDTQQELLRLARDVQVSTQLYTSLLNSAQELQIAKAGTVGNVRIIDQPFVPTEPAKPRKAVVLAMSVVLGLFLGVLLVFLRRALHHGVEDPAQVERNLGLATYAAIPFSEEQRRLRRQMKSGAATSRLLALTQANNVAVEALRSLRTSLHFALVEARNNVVMLTGPAPELGKSFLTINLGAVLALSGKKVLVIDADMRRGHLNEYVGCDKVPGLSDYIAGSGDVDSVIRPTEVENLHLITCGTTPPNPAELLLHGRFGELIDSLSKRYDHVLVDTPPVLAVTDAALVGRIAGCTLLVLKAGEHPLREIEEAARRLRQAGVDLRGTVFNQVGRLGGSGRYAPGYYGYSYGPKKAGLFARL